MASTYPKSSIFMSQKNIHIHALLSERFREKEALYTKALERFVEGGNGANLEKLNHSGKNIPLLYSIRINDKERLILTPITVQGQQEWLIIEILEDHRYDKLIMPQMWLDGIVDNEEYEQLQLQPSATDPTIKSSLNVRFIDNMKAIAYQNQHYIAFDEVQLASQEAPLPLIVSGAPGSGKTSLALVLLKNYINAHQCTEQFDEKILYVAQSPLLVNDMKREWAQQLALLNAYPNKIRVEFMTLQELYENSHQGPSSALENEDSYFQSWFKEELDKQRTVLKTQNKNKDNRVVHIERLEHSVIYQEIRTLSGYSSSLDYINAVGNSSLLSDKMDREWLYRCYQDYLKHLQNIKSIDLTLNAVLPQGTYNLVVVDEAQDFSRWQIKQLSSLAKEDSIVFCVGDHQQLYGSECIVPYIKGLFFSKEHNTTAVQHNVLQSSYRCPQAIIDFANVILRCKYYAIGIAPNKNEIRFAQSLEKNTGSGALEWINDKNKLGKLLIQEQNNADFAVISPTIFTNEAAKLFGEDRVFTPEQIKGLEYQHILLYRIFEEPRFYALNPLFKDISAESISSSESILKSKDGHIKHSIPFNEIFVAITRVQSKIMIYQPDTHQLTFLLNCIKKSPANHSIATEQIISTPILSTNEDWQRRHELLMAQNLSKQTNAMQNRLNKKGGNKKSSDTHRTENINNADNTVSPLIVQTNPVIDSINELIDSIKKLINDYPVTKSSYEQRNDFTNALYSISQRFNLLLSSLTTEKASEKAIFDALDIRFREAMSQAVEHGNKIRTPPTYFKENLRAKMITMIRLDDAEQLSKFINNMSSSTVFDDVDYALRNAAHLGAIKCLNFLCGPFPKSPLANIFTKSQTGGKIAMHAAIEAGRVDCVAVLLQTTSRRDDGRAPVKQLMYGESPNRPIDSLKNCADDNLRNSICDVILNDRLIDYNPTINYHTQRDELISIINKLKRELECDKIAENGAAL